MSKRTLTLAGVGIAAVAIVALLSASLSAQHAGHDMVNPVVRAKPAAEPHAMPMHAKHTENLAAALKSIDAATKLVEQDKKELALAELAKARGLVAKSHKAMAAGSGPKFVNVRCPIMGSAIRPDKVTAALTRTLNGRKVAFCCGGCPGAWDKLSDADKEAKLAKSKAKPKAEPNPKPKPSDQGVKPMGGGCCG